MVDSPPDRPANAGEVVGSETSAAAGTGTVGNKKGLWLDLDGLNNLSDVEYM